jgi:hypothetical protein
MRNNFTGDVDPAAALLAARISGLPSQIITGFGNREFDAVSDEFIAQTTASQSAVTKPGNFLTSPRKAQIRATLEAARQESKVAYFEFTAGKPHPEVAACIHRNALRIGSGYQIIYGENQP